VAVPPLWGGTFTYALPVAQTWYVQHPDWFTKPHHDYAAADIPVPTGTPVVAATAGVVIVSDTGGDCGHGVIVAGDDGATYTYCHGSSDLVTSGQRVATGQLLMLSGWSGNVEPAGPGGAHLHFQINIPNVAGTVCPQPALVAWADSATIDVHALPSTGCADGQTVPVVQKILVIGDSLTVGSGPSLSADLSATGAAVTVDAAVGSGLTNKVVDYRTRIPTDIAAVHPDLVVIALGTNDSGAGSGYGAEVDAVMNLLPAGQQVIWVLPRRPASLQPGIGQLAASVYAAVGRWPSLRVADVDGIMALHPEWVAPDGIHYNSTGYQTLGDAVFAYVATSEKLPVAAAVPGPAAAAQAAARNLVDTTWDDSQWIYLYLLWQRESGWNSTALNQSSGAYGIPQSLPADKMASAGPDWLSDPITQIRWGITYIQSRYGSPAAAWVHEGAFGWY
jgi:lysophospholipase L1-like esterase